MLCKVCQNVYRANAKLLYSKLHMYRQTSELQCLNVVINNDNKQVKCLAIIMYKTNDI